MAQYCWCRLLGNINHLSRWRLSNYGWHLLIISSSIHTATNAFKFSILYIVSDCGWGEVCTEDIMFFYQDILVNHGKTAVSTLRINFMHIIKFKSRVAVSLTVKDNTEKDKAQPEVTVFSWLLPISGDFPQPESQCLELIREADKLRSFIAVLRPVLAVLHDGPACCPLVPLALQLALLVAPHRFGRLFPRHVGYDCFCWPTTPEYVSF